MRLWHRKFDSRYLTFSTHAFTRNIERLYGLEFSIHPYKFGLSIDFTIWLHRVEINIMCIAQKDKSND